MPDVPAEAEAEEPTIETITDGYFEEGFRIDAADAGEFLIELPGKTDDETPGIV